MIKEVTMYAAQCDVCKTDCEYGEYSCYGDEDRAREEAIESGWHFEDSGLCYCENCHHFDDEDNLVIHEAPTPN